MKKIIRKYICAFTAVLLFLGALAPAFAFATDETYECAFSDPSYLEYYDVTDGDGTVTVENGTLKLNGGTLYPPVTQAVLPFLCDSEFVLEFDLNADDLSENDYIGVAFGASDTESDCYKVMYFSDRIQLAYFVNDTVHEVIFSHQITLAGELFVTVAVSEGKAFALINGDCVIECALKNRVDGKIAFQAKGATAYIDNVKLSNSEYIGKRLSESFNNHIYVPKTGIKNPPIVISYDNGRNIRFSNDDARSAVMIYRVGISNEKLCVFGNNGVTDELQIRYELNKGTVIPAFSVNDETSAKALSEWLLENGVKDGFIISSKEELIQICRKSSVYLKGVIDASSSITVNADDLYERAVKVGCDAVIVSGRINEKTVRSLRARLITVFSQCAGTTDDEIFACLKNGSNGIVCSDGEKAVRYIEKYTDDTVFRAPIVVSDGGDVNAGVKNSLKAIRSALNKGVQVIQVNVCVTSDGVSVISDTDETDLFISKTTISQKTFDELLNLKYNDERMQDEHILSLSQLLSTLKENYPDACVRVRIVGESRYTTRSVASEIKDAGMLSRVIILSPSEKTVNYVNSELGIKANSIYTPYSSSNSSEDQRAFYIYSYLQSVSSSYLGSKTAIPASLLPYLSARGITVHPEAIDTPDEVASYFGAGYDGFTTRSAVEIEKYISELKVSVDDAGTLSAYAVYYGGKTENVTDKVTIQTLSGDIGTENGVLKGSGVFALRYSASLPTGAKYTVYSSSVRYSEDKSENAPQSSKDKIQISEYSAYIISFGLALAVVIGFAIFYIVRKNKKTEAQQQDENSTQE
ncbi:MAG: hypothetical protein IKT65_02410 [Clostridia bacterium]|nr:hypothetical protein [Clostridia bacterium]